jgi:OmpA-OmpF porin, OOP family
MRRHILLLCALTIFLHLEASAQNDYKLSIHHRLIFNDFGSSASDAKHSLKDLPRGMELSFSAKIKENIRLNVPLRMAFFKNADDTTTSGRTFMGGDLQVQFEYPKYRIVPYIAVGGSIQRRLGKMDLGFPILLGLNLKIEDGFMLNLQYGYRQSFMKDKSNWHYGLGLAFNIGKIPAKKRDFSVYAPRNCTIVESLDIIGWWQIPLLAATRSKPPLPKVFEFPFGDLDGDGVADNVDDCPRIEGLASNKGCPIKEDLSWLNDVYSIAFDFGKASLLPQSYTFLDKTVALLNQYPTVKIAIQGHTDNSGTAVFNQELSENRAKACFDYMLSQGISRDRISYIGFGDTEPIADNATEDGRAKNRRAVFILAY